MCMCVSVCVLCVCVVCVCVLPVCVVCACCMCMCVCVGVHVCVCTRCGCVCGTHECTTYTVLLAGIWRDVHNEYKCSLGCVLSPCVLTISSAAQLGTRCGGPESCLPPSTAAVAGDGAQCRHQGCPWPSPPEIDAGGGVPRLHLKTSVCSAVCSAGWPVLAQGQSHTRHPG